MHPAPKWTLLARILRPQGRKGEVLADLYTDFPERFASRPEVWLAPAGFVDAQETGAAETGQEPQTSKVLAHWLPVGRNAGRIVLQFANADCISAAELLTGKDVDWKIEQKDAASYRGSGIAGTIDLPSGWATLTVEASDSTLRQDLTDLIERIEKDHQDKLFPPL